jgi:tRNA(Ile)-lysidine synthase TilS/MesJ
MEIYHKHQINMLRGKGATYADIATKLGLSENTIKSHCRRNNISTSFEVCAECGVQLVHLSHKKRKRFCSDNCRMAWWAKNPEARTRKAEYSFVCNQCQKPFTAYGNNKRKYCTTACAVAARGKVHIETMQKPHN